MTSPVTHHKHKQSNLDCATLPPDLDATELGKGTESTALISPISPSPQNSRALQRKLTGRPQVQAESVSSESLNGQARDSSGTSQPESPCVHEMDTQCVANGFRVRARLTPTCVKLVQLGSAGPCHLLSRRAGLPEAIEINDIIGVTPQNVPSSSGRCAPCAHEGCGLCIHTFKRTRRRRCQWKHKTVVLWSLVCVLMMLRKAKMPSQQEATTFKPFPGADASGASQAQETVQSWASKLEAALQRNPERPRKLFIVINPFGGQRQAAKTWERIVQPIFDIAGIRCITAETQHEGHARQMVEALPHAELASIDGVIAVGGDGLFQELLNGLLARRRASGEDGGALAALRLGHIPAGSTDAVAFSVHGTRCATTAALHIALGDRHPLDVLRVDGAGGAHRYAACVASYGYMGDLMRTSERLRWAGPPRYGLAGAVMLLAGRAYDARVVYMPASMGEAPRTSSRECRAPCAACAAAVASEAAAASSTPQGTAGFATHSHAALGLGGDVVLDGRFKSIMAVVTPCRSDMSERGLVPSGHLSDGRITLILVSDCSRAQYLRFLASIPRAGVVAGQFPFVEVVHCTAVQVSPTGPKSCWNVDGELLHHSHLAARIHCGLVSVFARGVE